MAKLSVADFVGDPRVQKLRQTLIESCAEKKFSDLVDRAGNQYIDLVMEGGGVLGIALVGYTYALEQVGIRFLGVGGTSAGAINALLIAGLGTPAEAKSPKMVELLANVDLGSFADGDDDVQDLIEALTTGAGPFKLGLKGLQVIDDLREYMGLNPGKAFRKWLSDTLAGAGITTTKQLREQMETLPVGLRKRGGKLLTVEDAAAHLALVAADVSTQTKVEFPKMAPMYWSDPDSVNPADYVRASMAIPLFFHPFRVENIPQGEKAIEIWDELASFEGTIPTRCTFVDGGIMSNFPIDLFHQPNSIPVAPTFGAKLGARGRQIQEIKGVGNLLTAAFDSARHCLDYDFIARNPDYKKLVTWIDTEGHHWLKFDMDAEEKIDLFYLGVRAATEFLVDFNWEKYKDLRAELARAQQASVSES